MRPVSPEFLRVVRGSHRMFARARVVPPGQIGIDPDGTEIPIEGGDVGTDATAEIRGTLDLTTIGTWPTSAGDLLAPYGNEVFVERGLIYGNGDTETVSQGYFRIDTLGQDTVPKGAIRLSGSDRMAALVDGRPVAPMEFGPGTSVASIFDFLVQQVHPTAVIEYDFDAGSTTFPGSHVLEDDRYDFLADIATSLGKIMYWDYRGVLVVRDAPDPTQAVFAVNHGEGGVLVEMSRELSREGVYNAVVATGEQVGEQPPVRAVAIDDNPDSPTWWYGDFGQVPRFYSSTFLTTTAQCQSAADALLSRQLGLPYNVDLSAVPNSALEMLDPIRVTYPGGDELHVVESLTLPLTADGAMTGTTKEKVFTGSGAL